MCGERLDRIFTCREVINIQEHRESLYGRIITLLSFIVRHNHQRDFSAAPLLDHQIPQFTSLSRSLQASPAAQQPKSIPVESSGV